MAVKEVWGSGIPILGRLPGINGKYSDNDVAKYLTAYWDELLVQTKGKVDDLYRQLDPLTCDEEWLDFLGFISGFSEGYSLSNYPVEAKRLMISRAFDLIWPNKGSKAVLEFILDALEINHSLWAGENFLAGITELPATLGGNEWRYYIRLPLIYLPNSDEFLRVELVKDLYGPVYADGGVCYDQFYAGFSRAGDPTF